MTADLSNKIVEIAHTRRRFGYRRIHDLLRPEYPGVNHKRLYRLYSAANLAVRKRKKAKRPASERVPLHLARTVNEVWSMDFVSDSLANGRRLKCLTVADDFSHECVDIAVDYGIGGEYVTRLLDRAAIFRGYPSAVRTDNGPEFTSRAFMAWAQGSRHTPHPDRAGTADAERLHRELQRQVQRRVSERPLVPDAAPGAHGHRCMATGLQRGQTAQQHRAHTTGQVRRAASPARRRCSSTASQQRREQLILQPGLRLYRWYG